MVTLTKFGMEMNKWAKLNNKNNVFSKPKRVAGKVGQYWFGIRMK